MDNLNISVYSDKYKRLSKTDKYRVVKSKLNSLFNSKKNTKKVNVVYGGSVKSIPYDKLKEYKDLLERKVALEKVVDYDDYSDIDTGTDGSALELSNLYNENDFSEELNRFFEENKSSTVYDTDDIVVEKEDYIEAKDDSTKNEKNQERFSNALNKYFEENKSNKVHDTDDIVVEKEDYIEVKDDSTKKKEIQERFSNALNKYFEENKSSTVYDTDDIVVDKEDNSVLENDSNKKAEDHIHFSSALNEFFEETQKPVRTESIVIDNNGLTENKTIDNNNEENTQQVTIENKEDISIEVENRDEFSGALNEFFEETQKPVRTESIVIGNNGLTENKTIDNNNEENVQQVTIENKEDISVEVENRDEFSGALNEFFEETQKPVRAESIVIDNNGLTENKTIDNNNEENTQQVTIENKEAAEEEDYSSVWSNVFNKDDIKETESINTETVESEEDYSSIWLNVFKKKTKKEVPFINSDDSLIDNSIDEEALESENDKKETDNVEALTADDESHEEKNNKKGIFRKAVAGIVSFSLFKKLYNKIKNRKKEKFILNPIEERNNKHNIKIRAFAYALAVTALVTTFLPAIGKKKAKNTNVKKFSISEKHNKVSRDDTVEDNIIYDEPIKEAVEEENTSVTFDDVVTISDNAYIYTNSYDAANETNNLTPLYDGSYERDVMGVVYNLDGNIYTIYSNDSNAYEEAELLISNGATVEAVLVTRSDISEGHDDVNYAEGYYSVDDVKVKTRIR